MMKYAIFIPTYKNRFNCLFNYIKNGGFRGRDVFLILSKDDEHLKEYYEYDFPENVKLIETECKNIGEKLQYILDYANLKNIKYIVEIEDDVREFGYKITPESKRKTSESFAKIKIPLVELVDKMLEEIVMNSYAFVSPCISFALGFSIPGKRNINQGLNYGQICVYDADILKEINFKYVTDFSINHDVDRDLKFIQNGKTCCTLADYGHEVIWVKDSKYSSVANSLDNTVEHKIMKFYLKYGDGCRLYVNKNYNELKMTIKTKKYWNTFDIPIIHDEYHDKLRELCKTNNPEIVKNFIKDSKIK